MVRGLYTAYTGMVAEQNRLDVISNNLANSATTGYKKKAITNQAFQQMLAIKIRDGSEAYLDRAVGKMSLGTKTGEVYTDFGQGSLRETGNTYDLAIEGSGFFQVRVANDYGYNTMKYIRDGNFNYTADGYIVDANGNHLQGESGDIQISTDAAEVAIKGDGSIYADGVYVDRILLFDFEDYDYLEQWGDNMYNPVNGATMVDATGSIIQGYTEQSNVNVVSEMVNMITVTRAYEAGQKTIQTIDGMLDKAANSVGRLG